MERKRELTSADIAALAAELSAYEGALFEKAYLYDEGLVRLKLRHFDHGRVELLIDLGANKHARIADPDNVPPAPERPPNFAMMLRNRLEGGQLAAAEQFAFDRILRLEFERETETVTLIAELFGDGNFAVVADGTVVDCVETVRLKSRTVAPGEPYEYPDARFDPLAASFQDVVDRFEDSDTDLVRTLATRLNFGGLWAEELCIRAGVEKTREIGAADQAAYRAVYEEIQTLEETLATGPLDPRVYEREDRPVDVTPVAMAEYDELAAESFERFTAALDSYFSGLEADADEQTGQDRPDFESRIEEKERIIDQQQGAIENFERQAEQIRERAESLYANYDFVDELLSTIREAREADRSWEAIRERLKEAREQDNPAAEAIRSIDGTDGTVTATVDGEEVELRVRDGVEKNADRLYREAKQIEAKKTGAETAIEQTREELASIRAEREAWADDDEDDAPTPESDQPKNWLERSSVPIRQSERWYERFRWFQTSDEFLVIGGRDATQNEELVKKYLDRGDLFFHAQAHGGPVTILKATGPSESYDDVTIPERSKAEAARFAVSHSSVWKDQKYAGDVYAVGHDQVSKTPESGEYLEKGGFAVRGDRTYFEDVPVDAAVGITCDPETRVIGGPRAPIEARAETVVAVEPGRYAQGDVAKRIYRTFRSRFTDESLVRKVASPDLIQEFLPPGTSTIEE
ncbi:hypothetical protein BRC62_02705 [Halobacteriales archaeon QH_10_67_13]|nr:MAG: hypothetical protein BRC62_02705 [Halobacteriales archaeon QH_10_67_13]